MSRDPVTTFFTISDNRFFLGTVALLNSLRLTGHEGPFVVLDVGLNAAQRSQLEEHARIVKRPSGLSRPQFKAFPLLVDASGVIVIIDSDMIVTRPLDFIIERAASGKICVYPDHHSQASRWFKEWETALQLKKPLRQQTYVNGGLIVLSTAQWPQFLSRLWEVAERVPPDAVLSGYSVDDRPFTGGDQDPLNALLMSEIPEDAVHLMPPAQEVHPDELMNTRIIDARTLECTLHGEQPVILHYSMAPKAWERKGWVRVRRDAYVQLLHRVVSGSDVRLCVESQELPLWLRPSPMGRGLLAFLDVTHGAVAAVRRRLPPRTADAVFRAKKRLMASSRSRR